jgi:hypothetical protein
VRNLPQSVPETSPAPGRRRRERRSRRQWRSGRPGFCLWQPDAARVGPSPRRTALPRRPCRRASPRPRRSPPAASWSGTGCPGAGVRRAVVRLAPARRRSRMAHPSTRPSQQRPSRHLHHFNGRIRLRATRGCLSGSSWRRWIRASSFALYWNRFLWDSKASRSSSDSPSATGSFYPPTYPRDTTLRARERNWPEICRNEGEPQHTPCRTVTPGAARQSKEAS